jgi:RNA-directed DNA polymerase
MPTILRSRAIKHSNAACCGLPQVAAILREEGFTLHHRKTRVMRQGVRQYLAGIVVNEHSNIARRDYDRLKAILTNCVRHGPESQNRESHPAFRQHLKGRVAFVAQVNLARGAKLHKLFEQIEW